MSKTTLATSLTVGMLLLSSACDLEPARDDLEVELNSPRDGGRGGAIGFNNDHHAALHFLVGGVGTDPAHSVTLTVGGVEHDLDAVWVEDGRLYGTAEGVEYSGADFLGSIWTVPFTRSGQYSLAELEITAVDETTIDRYEFRDVEWSSLLCGGVGGGSMAYVLDDLYVAANGDVTEDPGKLVLGCEEGGVAKAVMWGYGPDGVAQRSGFEAAIRMVIADYCGDGTSYTTEGEVVFMKDRWRVRPDPGTGPVEAGWSETGATCLSVPRDAAISVADVACGNSLPACPADPVVAGAPLATWSP